MLETPKHLIRLDDLSPTALDDLIGMSIRIKSRGARATLAGKSVGLLFFRGSLRTRASFTAAVHQLGGCTINLTASSDFWDLEEEEGRVMDGVAPEHIKDAAAVLSTYCNALAVRPAPPGRSWSADRRDAGIRSWAAHSSVPVINMESAQWHPLQALADLVTLREHLGDPRGKRLAIVWTHSPTPASHSVANSLLHAALREGMQVRLAHPPGYELDEEVMSDAREVAVREGTEVATHGSMEEAAEGAHVIYARSWGSLEHYGNPTLSASRRARHANWIVDQRVMDLGEDARFMHAMPVRRNLEVADSVLDGERSLVYPQAANRLHSEKALLSMMLRS